jgi:tRNA (guanine37-N1)-methyltransferase
MRFDVLTLHPELVRSPLEHSILGRAQKAGLIQAQVHEIRTFGRGRYRQVDDSPYGGGAGMVMRVDVVHDAIKSVAAEGARVILMSPGGVRFNQAHAKRLSAVPQLIFVCGHYEGIDARIEHVAPIDARQHHRGDGHQRRAEHVLERSAAESAE